MPVSGRPTPNIRWSKEGAANIDDHVQIDSNEHSTMLLIPEAGRDDTGKYTLHLDNSCGVISASCNVKVLDSPGPCQNLMVRII